MGGVLLFFKDILDINIHFNLPTNRTKTPWGRDCLILTKSQRGPALTVKWAQRGGRKHRWGGSDVWKWV